MGGQYLGKVEKADSKPEVVACSIFRIKTRGPICGHTYGDIHPLNSFLFRCVVHLGCAS